MEGYMVPISVHTQNQLMMNMVAESKDQQQRR